MKEKSLARNTLLYVVRVLSSMLFPLVTFPYISRVLSPAGIGKYNFTNSIISYFSLLAALGISTYAIREGAKTRNNKKEFEQIAQEMYSINVYSTLVAYLLLMILIVSVPKLFDYRVLLMILSFSFPLTTIGTEWIFNIYEDYAYITIRSILFQAFSLLMMFLIVKNEGDVNKYAAITVVSSAGSNILNYNYSKKYFHHKIILSRGLLRHLLPVLILFASAVASQIYVNLDTTMLGFIYGDYEVGIYASATKVYNIARSILTSFIIVITPRLAFYYSENKEKYKILLNDFLIGYSSIILPSCIGILCISKQVIFILSGIDYLNAVPALKILCIALGFSTIGSFIANEIMVICEQEKMILFATILGAVINFVGNIFFIPYIGYIGASITTLISEIVVFFVQIYIARKNIVWKNFVIQFIKVIIACIPMIIFSFFINQIKISILLKTLCIVSFGIFSYIVILFLLKHFLILEIAKLIQKKGE